MIKLTAIGNLGSDATITQTSGKSVINFSVAVTEKYKDRSGTSVENTTWIKCSLWDREALAQYLKKGTKVYIEGTPGIEVWNTDNNQEPAGTIKLNVFQVEFLSPKKDGE